MIYTIDMGNFSFISGIAKNKRELKNKILEHPELNNSIKVQFGKETYTINDIRAKGWAEAKWR